MSFRPPMGNMGYGYQGPPPGMMMSRGPPPMPMGGGPPPRPGMGGMPPRQGPPPGMMPRPMGPRPNLPPNQNKSKLVPQDIEDGEIEKPPVTTVFVGSISDRAPDNMIRTLLQRCGNIVSWKRVQGADGKLQAFGFCEFEVPEATLRCIRLLNEWPIAEKKVVVKVDDKTKAMLEEYEKSHVTEESDVKREDRLALAALDAVMREFAAELRRNAPREQPSVRHPREAYGVNVSGPKADEGLDDLVKDEEAKNLITREIDRFRQAYKNDEVVTEIKPGARNERGDKPLTSGPPADKEKDRVRDIAKSVEKDREGSRRRNTPERRARSDRPDRTDRPDRSDRGDRDRGVRDRGVERDRKADEERRRRTRSRSRERRERSRSPRKREEPDEDPDERYERLRMERQLRDKEQAYQERLKNWEVRERKKIREFERERQRSEERKSEEKKEARRLREFLEDYDDERDDPKYYKSHALTRRMKEREKEAEADARDRHKEKEEIEELRKKLVEEGHPDPESEINKRQNPDSTTQEEDMEAEEPTHMQEPISAAVITSESHNDISRVSSSNHIHSNHSDSRAADPAQHDMVDSADHHKKKKLTVKDVFNDDDDGSGDTKKKRPLVPLDYEDKKKPAKMSTEDKKAAIKQLIDLIPTEKSQLFAWKMDWDQVDQTLLDSRVKPWVNKKITEYIGEEEPTLTDFICQKVITRSSAQSILTDVAMVLDDEAETFVVKMWRLLVYETEAKKAGLVK